MKRSRLIEFSRWYDRVVFKPMFSPRAHLAAFVVTVSAIAIAILSTRPWSAP